MSFKTKLMFLEKDENTLKMFLQHSLIQNGDGHSLYFLLVIFYLGLVSFIYMLFKYIIY